MGRRPGLSKEIPRSSKKRKKLWLQSRPKHEFTIAGSRKRGVDNGSQRGNARKVREVLKVDIEAESKKGPGSWRALGARKKNKKCSWVFDSTSKGKHGSTCPRG